jgi:hypothetical protein
MRYYSFFIISIFLIFSACTGVDSQINKSFKNTGNTIALKDLTSNDYRFTDAGSKLEDALEDKIARSVFIITQESPSYVLKYKVLNYRGGSRLTRFSTFGLAKSAHGKLEVKVALYNEGKKVGAWTIDSWVKGGALGGGTGSLFQQVADEIMNHLRGNNSSF